MKCKHNDNIINDWGVVYDKTNFVEFHKRKELKEEICNEACDKIEQRICKILTSIST